MNKQHKFKVYIREENKIDTVHVLYPHVFDGDIEIAVIATGEGIPLTKKLATNFFNAQA